ncbi:hypothetical protein QBC35DRAFT_105519 [Podospora australis]|uniref:Cell wall proline rich protein n=1 Tax=Podospora australis TaxID=1536484 RepID=A0AAN7ANB0_9PEZI|nr:hypothetical protein QBC35DRAFT_105519 [Podospora australis]
MMAATFGPDMMMADIPTTEGLDHEVMRTMDSQGQLSSSPQSSPRVIPPPPNPPFVFPARPSSSSAPSSLSRATGRRPRSAIEPRINVLDSSAEIEKSKPRSPALPTFSFNPGASLPSTTLTPESAFLSPTFPPSAPSSPRTAAARPGGHGHRRGGSEFVGGKIRDGDSITVTNVSPTKSESGMASPMLQPAKPRRGHAHRRSAAISSHDLSSIILPPPHYNVRGNSAPSSPAFPDQTAKNDFPTLDQQSPVPESTPLPEPEIRTDANENTSSVSPEDERPAKPVARARVGFSDTLEYIPRPLSLVSSDASSTATARPGHSVSGSISSLISLSTGDRELNSPLGFSSTPKFSDSRPSTAGAVLERVLTTQEEEENLALRSPKRRGSIPFLGALPPALPLGPATPSPTRSTKKWTFFSREPFATGSPTRSQADGSAANSSHASSPVIDCESTEKFTETLAAEPELTLSSLKPLTKKKSKKQKKVKTWAGTILSRKSKYRYGKQKRRTPTPPPIRFTDELDLERLDQRVAELALDQERRVPSFTVTESSETDYVQNWTFPKPSSVPDEDMTYQMIDLDAALGPFNTPLPRNPEWEAAQRAGGNVKKQLHSAAGMSRFTGPGMHYHRRAESAPEMVPFEGGRLGFHRFGSSSTMADVFEEDEEEEDDDESSKRSTGNSTPLAETPASEKSEAAAPASDGAASPAAQQEPLPTTSSASLPLGGGFQHPSWATKSVSDRSTSSIKDEAADATLVPPGTPGDAASVNRCSGSTTPSPRHVFRPKDLAPVEVGPLNLPPSSLAPISPFSMTQSSAFPSPRTPMSYDAHRISTAPSSITEDNFHSLLMGEPGPEVRISVDDIPSLTSSNSTMTRESLFPHPQARNPPLNALPRPASFTSTAFGRRRSSLASLSRLISSSHGERSKLSMEVPMDSEPEKKTKVSKTKRLSRMVQFWKSKEDETV